MDCVVCKAADTVDRKRQRFGRGTYQFDGAALCGACVSEIAPAVLVWFADQKAKRY